MDQRGGRLFLSPSDLNEFLACGHRTALDLARAREELGPPLRPPPAAELLAARSRLHEAACLARMEGEGRDVARVGGGSPGAAALATEEAMRTGREVIHRAVFAAGNWHGEADFLLRVDGHSDLGGFAYEPAAAALAVHPRPYFALGLLFAADMLAGLQGNHPERIHALLADGEELALRPAALAPYAERVQRRFLISLKHLSEGGDAPYPYPVEHCAHCNWWARCRDRRRADDHVSRLTDVGEARAVHLEAAGIHTVAELMELEQGAAVDGIGAAALSGLRRRARGDVPSPGPGGGFERLPLPSAGDVFLAVERDPYRGGEPLEFLVGSIVLDGDAGPQHEALWAHDREQEAAALGRWVARVGARLEIHPGMHVYHRGPAAAEAIRGLAARHGDDDADELLRRTLFVDLAAIADEALAGDSATDDAGEPGAATRAYAAWLRTGEDGRLREVADANAAACRAAMELRDRLHAARGDTAPPPDRQAPARRRDRRMEAARLEVELTAGGADDAHHELAFLLNAHRRAAQPRWWAHFARLGRSPGGLREDREALGPLEPAGVPPEPDGLRELHALRFPAQVHAIAPGVAIDPETDRGVLVARVDDAAGLVWVARGVAAHGRPLPRALVPPWPATHAAEEGALHALAARVAEQGLGPDAACALLQRRPAELRDEALPEQVAGLGPGVLAVHGPPGAGATRALGDVAARLLATGRRVGIVAASHAGVARAVAAVEAAAAAERLELRGQRLASCAEPAHADGAVAAVTDPGAFPPGPDVPLLAGPAALWAREAMRGAVDVLLAEDAGTLALADALAAAGGGQTLVLTGDSLTAADGSALAHLLTEPATAIDLGPTRRMHPALGALVGRIGAGAAIHAAPGCEHQRVGSAGLAGSGPRLVEVAHLGRSDRAPEEAAAIAPEVGRLLDGGTVVGADDRERPLEPRDVLVLAPTVAQAGLLRARLPAGVRVGTPATVRGEEAAVVFISATGSEGESLPEGFGVPELLMGISRAQALAVLVCAPRLLSGRCATAGQLELVAALCAFAEAAG